MSYKTSKLKSKILYSPAGISRNMRAKESADAVIKDIAANKIKSEAHFPLKIFMPIFGDRIYQYESE